MRAMILAAGTGTRLLPLTHLRPKPLFPIFNTPLLGLTVTQLMAAGVKDIIINTHHLSQQIHTYLRGHTPPGVTISVSDEPHLLGTAGALKKVEDFWGDQPFIVINGDIIHTIDLSAAYQHHLGRKNLATLILHSYPRFNQVEIDHEGIILGIREKRVQETSFPTHRCAFTGIHIISPELLAEIPPNRCVDIITTYLNLIFRGMKVCGYQVADHYWCDIGTPQDYHSIHHDLYRKKVRLRGIPHHLAARRESPLIAPDTTFEGYVSVGENSTIGKNCTIINSIIWDEVEISNSLTIEDCIIGDRVKVRHSLKGEVVVE